MVWSQTHLPRSPETVSRPKLAYFQSIQTPSENCYLSFVLHWKYPKTCLGCHISIHYNLVLGRKFCAGACWWRLQHPLSGQFQMKHKNIVALKLFETYLTFLSLAETKGIAWLIYCLWNSFKERLTTKNCIMDVKVAKNIEKRNTVPKWAWKETLLCYIHHNRYRVSTELSPTIFLP